MEREVYGGREKKSKKTPLDQFFMLLCILKHGGSWQSHAEIFKIKSKAFERMIIKVRKACKKVIYPMMVKKFEDGMKIQYPSDHNERFDCFSHARYATDVTFKHTNRPVGRMHEARPYYSAKHKLHEYKTDISLLPNGICPNVSNNRKGSVSDI